MLMYLLASTHVQQQGYVLKEGAGWASGVLVNREEAGAPLLVRISTITLINYNVRRRPV